jgi:hypothetical protein
VALKSGSVSFFILCIPLSPLTFIRVKIVLAGRYFTDKFQVIETVSTYPGVNSMLVLKMIYIRQDSSAIIVTRLLTG